MTQYMEAYGRAQFLASRSINKEQIARFINAEFHMNAYVSKNKVWAQFTEEGKLKTSVIA